MRRQGGPHSLSGRVGKKKFLPCRVSNHYTSDRSIAIIPTKYSYKAFPSENSVIALHLFMRIPQFQRRLEFGKSSFNWVNVCPASDGKRAHHSLYLAVSHRREWPVRSTDSLVFVYNPLLGEKRRGSSSFGCKTSIFGQTADIASHMLRGGRQISCNGQYKRRGASMLGPLFLWYSEDANNFI
jgi:hypothetical protein